ncbi:hypothetical protein AAU61_02880 [Desulfocarbo indianensis]|nr:hypothetical protein AAU61_02880 [Desulfocarbo indianensis]
MKFKRGPEFDPQADLAAIADLAQAWRSQFRPAKVTFASSHFQARLEELSQAHAFRLYLVTRPDKPVPLAILHPLTQDEVMLLLALSPLDGEDLARPLEMSPHEKSQLMAGAPEEPSGRGVYPFLLGEPQGMAILDLEPEGLVLTMSKWGHLNLLEPEPLLAQRMRRLGAQINRLAKPRES